jgi:hypothetical protein
MVHLSLAGLSEDGTRLLLLDDAGVEYTLAVDPALRAALRGEHARLGQLEIKMDSAIRPRDIQARIRAGETPESVAEAAQTSVDRIMTFAGPVLDERAHVAQRAQRSTVRRRSGEGSLGGGRTLGDAVSEHLRDHNVDPRTVEWDAFRREDGKWTLTARYAADRRTGAATFSFDVPGNYVTVDDEDARWLVGEVVDTPAPASAPAPPSAQPSAQPAAEAAPRKRRLSAVPAEELPLGDDAIELVSGEEPSAEAVRVADDDETVDLTEAMRGQVDETQQPAPVTPATTAAPEPGSADAPPATDDGPGEPEESQASEPPRRSVKKSRGRASVPSWDEIMFGGGKGE